MAAPKIPLGVFVYNPNIDDPAAEAAFVAAFDAFTAQMGVKPQFMNAFTDYRATQDQWVGTQNQLIRSWVGSSVLNGVIPVMTIPLASNADFGNQDKVFADIVAGKYDAVFRGLVTGWRDAGYQQIYARIGPEMNGGFVPWYMGDNPTTIAAFVKAFQHVADLVHAIPGIDVKTVWNPANLNWTAQSTALAWPGDSYVDVIGADPYSTVYPVQLYNWGKNDGSSSATLQEWFADPANRIHYWDNPNATQWNPNGWDPGQWGMKQVLAFATAHNKPIGLAEAGAGGDGTSTGPVDDPVFVKWLYDRLTAPGAPPVAFANIWDINPSDGNWKFTDGSKPNALAAWQQYFGDPSNVQVGGGYPTPPVVGTGPDTLILAISEDAYQGDAQFTVSIDGVQMGGVMIAQAPHSGSQHQDFTFRGTWAASTLHTVTVNFLNDGWGGSAALDRNLYVDSLTIDGAATVLGAKQGMTGAQTYAFGTAATSITFVDSNNQRLTTAVTPGLTTSWESWRTGLNNNIYEWVQDGNVTGIGAASFDMIQIASLTDGSGGSFRLNNFDESDVSLSGASKVAGQSSKLIVDNAMRGSIALGEGNYDARINVLSAYADPRNNTFRVSLGSGTDTLVLQGDPARTFAIVNAGSGTSTMSFVNVLNSVVIGGAGQATVNLGSGSAAVTAGVGRVDVHGGTAPNTFIFHTGGGLLTVDSFNPTKGDTVQVDAALRTGYMQTKTAAGVMLSFGTQDHGVLLKGATSVPQNSVTFV